MNRRLIGIACGTGLLIAAAVAVVASLNRRQPLPEVPVEVPTAEVRVKAVERKAEPVEQGDVASRAVAIVCGMDEATADRYEVRNDALRSIARRRDLPKGDVEALLAYLRSQDDALRVERVAALKNDVMNLLRNQDPPVEGLVETLIAMFEGKDSGECVQLLQGRGRPCHIGLDATTHNSSTHNSQTSQDPPVVLDYCIQHLGAMVNELDDAARVGRSRGDRPTGWRRIGWCLPYRMAACAVCWSWRRARRASRMRERRSIRSQRTGARRARRRPRRSAALPS